MKKTEKKGYMTFIIFFGLLLTIMGYGCAGQEKGEYEKKITLLNEELKHCQDKGYSFCSADFSAILCSEVCINSPALHVRLMFPLQTT